MTPETIRKLPWLAFYAARAAEVKAEYPDADVEDIELTLADSQRQWIAALRTYERQDVVPVNVLRSCLEVVGRADTTRMLRHTADFYANLPMPRTTLDNPVVRP